MNEDETSKRVFEDLIKLTARWNGDKIPLKTYVDQGLELFIGLMFIGSSSSQEARDKLQYYLNESYGLEQEIIELKKRKTRE